MSKEQEMSEFGRVTNFFSGGARTREELLAQPEASCNNKCWDHCNLDSSKCVLTLSTTSLTTNDSSLESGG
jgi:hypothetical protein